MTNFAANDPLQQVLTTVNEAVRKSLLINALHEKLESLPVGAFPFAAEFGRLRDVIAPQIGDTRILFPEFTPHDEALHVVKLFQLADKFFSTAYQQLNPAELFLLGSALYAHDWGMAVGQHEKEYLRHGAAEAYLHATFNPLPDESDRLSVFVRTEGLHRGAVGTFPELSDDHLRLYVRLTHARRSGARVRAHFHQHPAVGEALAHICEGHWLDFATLDDPHRFPRDYEVAGQTTHLLALTLQVRLIDLFHITEDRTPYALWRFVSPTERRSKEEWKKHRALHGVAVNDFPPGRSIKLQGFTEDEEVWAGLQDLRHYCDNQVTRTLDLCARHVPKRYMLDFLKLEWAVPTGTLRPVSFSFGFDSRAMFRILSDDIYDGERHVFLRELLQNSIDAIRMRRTRYEQREKNSAKRKLTAPPFDTTIYFTAEHQSNGDINVTCRDYGVGMDEHVIRNYFTVAGISYYRSDEFKRQHVGFEPVSRFGIGILSCFMVADTLDVKTYRDPECGPPMAYSDTELPGAEEHRSRRLYLKVPAVDRQFIVKELLDHFEVGTEVSLRVLRGKAISPTKQPETSSETDETIQDSHADFKRTLEITEYLCKIAGFVEFPILVDERWPGQDSPKVTLILHPDQDAEDERQQFAQDVAVHQLSREYPWEKVAAPESITMVRKLMTEQRFELRELLGDKGYEGWLVFPMPLNEQWDFGLHRKELRLCKRTKNCQEIIPLKWNELSDTDHTSVYRDGILLSKMKMERVRGLSRRGLPPILMRVNLSSSESPQPNVSRTSLISEAKSWDDSIWTAIYDRLRETRIAASRSLSPAERLYRLGWLMAVFGKPDNSIEWTNPDYLMITLWLMPDGKLEARESALLIDEEIPVLPKEADPFIEQLIPELWDLPFEHKVEFEWQGPASLCPSLSNSYFFITGSSLSLPADETLMLLGQRYRESLIEASLQFLEPPEGRSTLIAQSTCVVRLKDGVVAPESSRLKRINFLKRPEISKALEAALENIDQLDLQQLKVVYSAVDCTITIPFNPPFSKCSSISHRYNLRHAFGKTLLRCLVACCIAERDGQLSKAALKTLNELRSSYEFTHTLTAQDLTFYERVGFFMLIDADEFANRLFGIVKDNKLIDGFVPPSIPDDSEAVPEIRGANKLSSDSGQKSEIVCMSKFKSTFGKLITEWPLPDRETQPKETG